MKTATNLQPMTRCSPSGECTGACREGRNCLDSLNATRAIFRMAPLHQEDGGATFHRGIVMPITDEDDEQMEPTPAAADLARVLRWRFILIVLVAVGAAAAQVFI